MIATIYVNHGVLAHEKQNIYTTAPESTAVVSEPLYIIIPEEMNPYITRGGFVALSVPNGRNPYLLYELLDADRYGMPILRYIGRDDKKLYSIKLEIAESEKLLINTFTLN